MDMQNVSNLTIPEGQVRTIHDKDSRLIWGRVAYNTKYAGDTFQQTYSGKNLFNYQGVVNLAIATTIAGKSTYRGYYIQANAGDTFTLSRATTTGNNRFRVCFTMVEPARGVEVYNENGVVERYISADDATEVSFTVPQDMHYVFIYLSSSGQDITESLKIQLETGSTATAYEPYVGGIPAPNPDYPQPISTVTGEQTVRVTGKNLLNASADTGSLNGVNYTKNGDGTYTVNGTANGTSSFIVGSIELTANTQYVASGCPGTGSGSSYNVRIRDANYTALGFDVGNGVTITPTETKTYYYQITVVSGYSVSNLVFKPMICLSTTSNPDYSSYEPYQGQSYTVDLGSIGLAKIGDYQDYIYKSGDDWYVRKEIRHLSLPIADMDNSDSYPGWINQGVVQTDLPSLNNGLATVTRYYANVTMPNAYTGSDAAMYCNTSQAGGLVMLLNTGLTQTQLKNRYPNLVVEVYYGIVNPIADTKITDATLVGQLNDIHEWLTRYGYESTVSGNLPIVLQRDSLQ